MCRKVFAAALILSSLLGVKAKAVQYAYQVIFTDKNSTPYSLSNPSLYLSARAIDRRTRQGIAIDSTDIPVNQTYINQVLTLTGGKFHEASRWFNFCVILVSDSAVIHSLDNRPYILGTKFIAYYADSLHRPLPPGNTYNNPDKRPTSGGSAYYGETWNQTNMVKGNFLHDNGFTGGGKLIAVLDGGFIATDTHPGFHDLWSSGRVLDVHDFVHATESIFAHDTHGTKVLSTMAGYAPNTYVGSAPMASYALYISEDANSEQPIELINMLCATERADSLGADIVSTSLGYNLFDNGIGDFNFSTDFDGKTTIAAQAANVATLKGILFVASAGNEGGNSWNFVLTPGDADSALTIGSVDISGTNAPNSGYGPNAAGQVKPDVCAMGQPGSIFTTTGGYGTEGGTSFATPQVAGWAACLWQSYPKATPYQIKQAIRKCASSFTTPGPHIGYGIPNFQCATNELLNVIDPHNGPRDLISALNPFKGEMQMVVTTDTDQYVDIALIDVTGRIVTTIHQLFTKQMATPVTVPVYELPHGLYFLKAVSPTRQQVLKVEKI